MTRLSARRSGTSWFLRTLQPCDLRGEAAAFLWTCRDAHHEPALKQPIDRTFQLAEALDMGDHAIADLAFDRGRKRDGAAGQVHSATGEHPAFAPRIAQIGKGISSRNIGEHAETGIGIREVGLTQRHVHDMFSDTAVAPVRKILSNDACRSLTIFHSKRRQQKPRRQIRGILNQP